MLTPEVTPAGVLRFRRYDEASFQIGEQRYECGLLLHRGSVCRWGPASFAELSFADFAPLLDNPPELLLVGTGKGGHFPEGELYEQLAKAPFVCEWMNSGACVRTFNLLVSEGRNVSAALLLPGA